MASRVSTAAAKAANDAVTPLLNGGYVQIRDGAQPASVATAASGVLLGTVTLSATAFGAATDASPSVATANAIASDTAADASGTAGWFRAFTSAGVAVIDGNITTTAVGTGDMLMDSTTINAGDTFAVSSWTIEHPTE